MQHRTNPCPARVLAMVLFALSALSVSPARAQSEQDEIDARRHFTSAQAYFDRGAYEDATREWRAAYALSHRSGLLFNIHLAEERLGHYAIAADLLAQYLAEDPAIEDRELLEDRLANLRARAAEQAATPVDTATTTSAPEAATPTPVRRRGVPTASLVAFGIGGAGLVSFAVAGGLALAKDHALASSCGADAGRICTDADVAPLRRRDRAADVSLATGLAAAATGAILYFVLDRDEAPPVTAYVSPNGTGLSFQTRF